MRRKDLEEESYNGKLCNYNELDKTNFNGVCGEYSCCSEKNTECKSFKKTKYKEWTEEDDAKYTKDFNIPVEQQWALPEGKANPLLL